MSASDIHNEFACQSQQVGPPAATSRLKYRRPRACCALPCHLLPKSLHKSPGNFAEPTTQSLSIQRLKSVVIATKEQSELVKRENGKNSIEEQSASAVRVLSEPSKGVEQQSRALASVRTLVIDQQHSLLKVNLDSTLQIFGYEQEDHGFSITIGSAKGASCSTFAQHPQHFTASKLTSFTKESQELTAVIKFRYFKLNFYTLEEALIFKDELDNVLVDLRREYKKVHTQLKRIGSDF